MSRWRIATGNPKGYTMSTQNQQQGNPNQPKPGESQPSEKRSDQPQDPSQKQEAAQGQTRSHNEATREQQDRPDDKQRI